MKATYRDVYSHKIGHAEPVEVCWRVTFDNPHLNLIDELRRNPLKIKSTSYDTQ
jgi:hypothetical protein